MSGRIGHTSRSREAGEVFGAAGVSREHWSGERWAGRTSGVATHPWTLEGG